jgi:hypothetical protein
LFSHQFLLSIFWFGGFPSGVCCFFNPLLLLLCTSILKKKEIRNREWRHLSYLASKDYQRRREASRCLSQWLRSIQHSRNPLIFLDILLCWIDHVRSLRKPSQRCRFTVQSLLDRSHVTRISYQDQLNLQWFCLPKFSSNGRIDDTRRNYEQTWAQIIIQSSCFGTG